MLPTKFQFNWQRGFRGEEFLGINQLHKGGKTMYAEEVPIYTNQTTTERRLEIDIYI
jgi:hypothetical protein